MAENNSSPVPHSIARVLRLPVVVILLAAVVVLSILFWPNEQLVPIMRTFLIAVTLVALFLTLLVWFFLLSPFSRKKRLCGALVLTLLGVAAIGSIRRIEFGGDASLFVEYRWAADQAREIKGPEELGGRIKDIRTVQFSESTFDYPEYRGRKRDAVVEGPKLSRDWNTDPPRYVWNPPIKPIGGGYSQFAVVGDVLVTMEQRDKREAITCYRKSTGDQIWIYDYDSYFYEVMGGEGPRATPTVWKDHVYSLGAKGNLSCVELQTGRFVWSVETLSEAGGNLEWAMSGSPLVRDQFVVVHPGVNGSEGKPGTAIHAYHPKTGQVLWKSGSHRTAYVAPMLATFSGMEQIIIFDSDGVAGIDPMTGLELWRFAWRANGQGINVAQPIALGGDRLFICTGYGGGCAGLQISRIGQSWKVAETWEKSKALKCQFTSPVLFEGFIYGIDESGGILTCVNPSTGKRQWREGRFPSGQLLRSDDLLLVTTERGDLALVQASPSGFHQLGRIKIFNDKFWNCPALSDGRLYLRNHRQMTCLDLRPIHSR